jgi:TolB-like protein
MNQNSSNSNTNPETPEPKESGSEKPAQPTRISLFKDLLSRRVPQILGGYLAASWIILEFMDWLVRRYPISPHLVEFCLVALAALIPTVLMLAYFHGKPGPDQWTRVEKIGIPTNLLATAILLVFLFQGRDLGATTTTVTLFDEQGQQIERSVPKSEFRKKVTIFSLENESGDTKLDWLVHAIPDMLRYDLTQDIYLDIRSVYSMYEDIKDEGYPEAVSIPMTLKKKIAEGQYTDYFTSGTFNKQDGQISILISLHNTKTTKLLSENLFTGNDIFPLVDDITDWFKNALTIPQMHIEKTRS